VCQDLPDFERSTTTRLNLVDTRPVAANDSFLMGEVRVTDRDALVCTVEALDGAVEQPVATSADAAARVRQARASLMVQE
jgi:hypothetical protein